MSTWIQRWEALKSLVQRETSGELPIRVFAFEAVETLERHYILKEEEEVVGKMDYPLFLGKKATITLGDDVFYFTRRGILRQYISVELAGEMKEFAKLYFERDLSLTLSGKPFLHLLRKRGLPDEWRWEDDKGIVWMRFHPKLLSLHGAGEVEVFVDYDEQGTSLLAFLLCYYHQLIIRDRLVQVALGAASRATRTLRFLRK